MLGRTANDLPGIADQMREILSVAQTDDGIVFQPEALRIERITESAEYEGVRIRLPGSLTTARFVVQVDIGFGDAVYPPPEEMEFPTLLGSPAPRLWCYSRESVIAEKLQIMVRLDALNSRMKDYYDTWMLSRQFAFDGQSLAEAVRQTFARRHTGMPAELQMS